MSDCQEYSSLPTYGRRFIFWFLLFHILILTGLSVSPVTKSKSHAMNTSEHISHPVPAQFDEKP